MPTRKTNKPYRVRWEIDVDARSIKEAAKKALEIQRDPESTALFFDVTDNVVEARVELINWVGIDLGIKPREVR